jgi:hypothetical protein
LAPHDSLPQALGDETMPDLLGWVRSNSIYSTRAEKSTQSGHPAFEKVRYDCFQNLAPAHLIDVEALDSRLVGSRGADELSVVGDLDPAADGRHVEVLDQFYPPSELNIFL